MAKRVESPSSINTFKQCKRKYYYQYIAKLPTLPNVHQVRGTIAHSTLEEFYNTEVRSLLSENYAAALRSTIQELFFMNWKKAQLQLRELRLSPDQERFYFEETLLMLMNWTNQHLERLEGVMKTKEISFPEAFRYLTPIREEEYVSDNYAVRGFIDAIHQLDDEVQLIDYKTNATFEMKDSLKLQLAIYSLLYFEKHGKLPSKVGIFFLRHKLKLMNVDDELLNLAKREIELIHAHTSQTEALADYPRCTGPLCKWSTGKCDFYDVCKPFHTGESRE